MKLLSFFLSFGLLLLNGNSLEGAKSCRQSITTPSTPSEIVLMESRCIVEINKIRRGYGLKELKAWNELTACARKHSSNMAVGNVDFGHDGFKKRSASMQKIVPLASFGENVAYNYLYEDPVKQAVQGWMKSPSHRENILGDYHETGVGIAISKDKKYYFTQLFSKCAL